MTEEKDLIETKSFSELLGMEFNEDGSMSKMKETGTTPIFQRMNRKQRRSKGMYSHKFQKTLKRV